MTPARVLVRDLVAIARADGARRIEVPVNQHAVAFYMKIGFVLGHDVEIRFGPALRMCVSDGLTGAVGGAGHQGPGWWAPAAAGRGA